MEVLYLNKAIFWYILGVYPLTSHLHWLYIQWAAQVVREQNGDGRVLLPSLSNPNDLRQSHRSSRMTTPPVGMGLMIIDDWVDDWVDDCACLVLLACKPANPDLRQAQVAALKCTLPVLQGFVHQGSLGNRRRWISAYHWRAVLLSSGWCEHIWMARTAGQGQSALQHPCQGKAILSS